MVASWRKILFPFAVLYGWITGLRNVAYDRGWLKSYRFDFPIIAVGNLSVGGTGKSPMIEYLVRLLHDRKMATLSRGYKRKSKGYLLADAQSTAHDLGDEPFQFHRKFPGLHVAVDADRKNGIERLGTQNPEVILLDDAFQHRRVTAGFYVLLTAYDDLYTDDWMLPAGNLREPKSGAKRADVIVVTKCPADLSLAKRESIERKIRPMAHQQLFFTAIAYDRQVFSESGSRLLSEINGPLLLVAGIAKPEPFFAHLRSDDSVEMAFSDHHDFTDAELQTIRQKAVGRTIVTTEKDFVRLQGKLENLYYLPIRTVFLADGQWFDQAILNYVDHAARIA